MEKEKKENVTITGEKNTYHQKWRQHCAVWGCAWLYWAVLGCSGLFWAAVCKKQVFVVQKLNVQPLLDHLIAKKFGEGGAGSPPILLSFLWQKDYPLRWYGGVTPLTEKYAKQY